MHDIEPDFEKLGVFYLGKEYDRESKQVGPALSLYDSKDMLLHAVCLTQQEVSKAELCIGILEEAAIDSIPVIAIDTTGAIANILLQFPQLHADDFKRWANREKVRASRLPVETFAEQEAQRKRSEMLRFEQTGDRIQRMKDTADFAIYTPGSSAGRTASFSGALLAPSDMVLADHDLLRERISACTASILGLIGVFDKTGRGREHVLLANIFKTAWQKRHDLTFAEVIRLTQQPNFTHIGAMEVDSVYPANERQRLAMDLNNLVASLDFEALINGKHFSIDSVLHTSGAKPKVSIFSIAHLGPNERMFVVTQLLNELSLWTRAQSNTHSLRAILYLDEIAEYYPVSANSPAKGALNTLLSIGGEHGLGVLLSSTRPADIDYQGLQCIHTWIVGQINSETDRAHVLNGIELAAVQAGKQIEKASLNESIALLDAGAFLLNNVHESSPMTFFARSTLSYLSGPLSLDQIRSLALQTAAEASLKPAVPAVIATTDNSPIESPQPLGAAPIGQNSAPTSPMQSAKSAAQSINVSTPAQSTNVPAQSASATTVNADAWWVDAQQSGQKTAETQAPHKIQSSTPMPPRNAPGAPPGVTECFLPVRQVAPSDAKLVYRPMLFAVGNVKYIESKAKLDTTLQYCILATTLPGLSTINWEKALPAKVWMEDVIPKPEANADFETVPTPFDDATAYTLWTRDFITWLCNAKRLNLFHSEATNMYSKPRETERDFRIRLEQTARELRDKAAETLRLQYVPYLAKLHECLSEAQSYFRKLDTDEHDHKIESAHSLGKKVFGEYIGRKAATWATDHSLDVSEIAHKTGANRAVERTTQDNRDMQRATEMVEKVTLQIDDANLEFGVAMSKLESKFDPLQTPLTQIVVAVPRGNISVPLITLGWAPFFRNPDGTEIAAWIRAKT